MDKLSAPFGLTNGGWQIATPLGKSSMTPEQLQQYVDAALKQRDQFNLVFYPLTIVLSVGGAWLISYVGQKGKNLATKEDIRAITKAQEEIRNELANRSHFSRARYDREMEVFQKVWPKLMSFFQATYLSEDITPTTTQNRYAEARDEVIMVIRENIPFFAKEIRQEVLAFQLLCEEHRLYETLLRRRDLTSEEMKNYSVSHNKIKAQLDKVEEAIRNRLSKFD